MPTLALGGAERVFVTLLRNLDPTRFDLALTVGSRANGPLISEIPPHVTLFELGTARVRDMAPRLVSLVWRFRPAVIVSTLEHMNLALCLSRPCWPSDTKHVVRTTSLTVLDNWPMRWGMRLLYPFPDAIIYQSDLMKSQFLTTLRLSSANARVVKNPLDIGKVRTQASDPTVQPAYEKEAINLVAIGRFESVKGFDLLARALAWLDRRLCLTIIGGGPDREPFERLVSELGLKDRIRMVGYQLNPYPFIAQADALVLPSRSEGFPNVVLEALSLGVPVVCTPVAGLEAILANEPSCFVANAITADGLAEALTRFIAHPKSRLTASPIVADHDAANIAKQYEDLFHSLIR
jgi:glycosyltransferase involved in cell wall biosynthesis